jgi:hypothetical protein
MQVICRMQVHSRTVWVHTWVHVRRVAQQAVLYVQNKFSSSQCMLHGLYQPSTIRILTWIHTPQLSHEMK